MDSFVQQGVTLKGILTVKGVVLVEGHVEGEVFAEDHLIVGESGTIHGNIEAGHLTNRGTIQGNVTAGNKVVLTDKSHLEGDITAFQLVTEEGASFDGRCKMLTKPAYQEKPDIPEPVAASELPSPETDTPAKTISNNGSSREPIASGFAFGQFFRQLFSG